MEKPRNSINIGIGWHVQKGFFFEKEVKPHREVFGCTAGIFQEKCFLEFSKESYHEL